MSLGRRIKKLQSQNVGADEAYPLGQAFINVVGKHYERKPRRWKDEDLAEEIESHLDGLFPRVGGGARAT